MKEDCRISYGSDTIEFTLERKRVRNINLRIYGDGNINVSAPFGLSKIMIDDFVRSRYDFILNAKERIRAKENEKSRLEPEKGCLFLDDGSLRYLGKSYDFKISFAEDDRVELGDNTITAFTYDVTNREYAERLLADWFYNNTSALFRRLNDKTAESFATLYKLPKASVKIKYMKSRWGSCYVGRGIITINPRLIFYPEDAARYVFVHEYSHFIVPNHSPEFYRTVRSVLPQYEKFSALLK